MSSAFMFSVVLLGVYGLVSLLISVLVQISWSGGLDRTCQASRDLLALRLLPAGGGLLVTLGVAMPAFLIYEPARQAEDFGPALVVLALLAIATVGDALHRGWRAWSVTRRVLRSCVTSHFAILPGLRMSILDADEPVVAIVGGWRPKVIATRSVIAECSREEFRQIIAHEAAHLSARDNLKLLMLLVSPDVLAWLPAGRALIERWRVGVEHEADERATGSDRHKRLELASALVKVARLSLCARDRLPPLGLSIALNNVDERVRQLLSPATVVPRIIPAKAALICALLIPVIAAPFLSPVQQLVESLVAFGR
jgi:Zn-dependent protease with chaperone function